MRLKKKQRLRRCGFEGGGPLLEMRRDGEELRGDSIVAAESQRRRRRRNAICSYKEEEEEETDCVAGLRG